MNRDKARAILEAHNRWRRGDDSAPSEQPWALGRAIDVAVAELSKPAAVPDELTDKQVVSACFSYRHDYGLMDGKTRGHLEFQCREWWRAIRKELEHPSQHPMVLAARPQPPAPAVDVRELVEAAEAVVRRWDSPLWSQQGHTGDFIARLRAALAKFGGGV